MRTSTGFLPITVRFLTDRSGRAGRETPFTHSHAFVEHNPRRIEPAKVPCWSARQCPFNRTRPNSVDCDIPGLALMRPDPEVNHIPDSGPSSARWDRIDMLSFAAVIAGMWAVLGRYYGLQHDAQVYVLQALARLQPEIYRGDIFLRYGSQDSFTLFPAVSAELIDWLGVDRGAAALTLVALVSFYAAAWLLIRSLLGARQAWLAVALLIAVPGWYGTGQVFQVTERFFSARLPAEALCLVALWAGLSNRHLICAALLGAAAVVHPLMAAPAAIIAVSLAAGRLFGNKFTMLVPLAAALCALAGARLLLGDSAYIDGDWLDAVRSRSAHLFLDRWLLSDWLATGTALATLTLASLAGTPAARPVALAALWTAIAGLFLTAVTTWWLPLTLLLQGQPWRWVWIAVFLSIVLLPSTIAALWNAGQSGRVVALVFSSGWALAMAARGDTLMAGCGAGLLAIALVTFAVRDRLTLDARVLRAVAWAFASFACIWISSLVWTEARLDLDLGRDPVWLQAIAGALKIPPVGAMLFIVALLALQLRRRWPWVPAVVAVTGLTILAAAVPGAWTAWSTNRFSQAEVSGYSSWRAHIGESQEVLWPEGLAWTWFSVGRRSYLSISQLAGVVFSEEMTEEARRRAEALSNVYSPDYWFGDISSRRPDDSPIQLEDLRAVCRAPGVDFYVSPTDLGLAVATAEWPTRGKHVYLYDCAAVQRSPVS